MLHVYIRGAILQLAFEAPAAGVCICHKSAFTVGFLEPWDRPGIVGDIFRPVFQESPERLLLFQTLLCTTGWRSVSWSTAEQRRGEALKLIITADCCVLDDRGPTWSRSRVHSIC